MGDDRPVARVFNVGIGHIAGVHVVATTVMVGFSRAHRPDDGHLVHQSSHLGHVLADLNITGGRDRTELTTVAMTWLEIPDIHGRGSATHPEQDRGLAILLELVGVRSQGVSHGERRAGQSRGSGHVSHEVAPRHSGRGGGKHGIAPGMRPDSPAILGCDIGKGFDRQVGINSYVRTSSVGGTVSD